MENEDFERNYEGDVQRQIESDKTRQQQADDVAEQRMNQAETVGSKEPKEIHGTDREYVEQALRDARMRPDEVAAIRRGGDGVPEGQREVDAVEARKELNEKAAAGRVTFSEPEAASINASDISVNKGAEAESYDASHPEFWNHDGNTIADYEKMADKYPEIRQGLENGRTLEELKEDPDLGEATRFWHNDSDPVRVIEYKGHHHLESGHHRVELAKMKDLGEIPVYIRKTTDS